MIYKIYKKLFVLGRNRSARFGKFAPFDHIRRLGHLVDVGPDQIGFGAFGFGDEIPEFDLFNIVVFVLEHLHVQIDRSLTFFFLATFIVLVKLPWLAGSELGRLLVFKFLLEF